MTGTLVRKQPKCHFDQLTKAVAIIDQLSDLYLVVFCKKNAKLFRDIGCDPYNKIAILDFAAGGRIRVSQTCLVCS